MAEWSAKDRRVLAIALLGALCGLGVGLMIGGLAKMAGSSEYMAGMFAGASLVGAQLLVNKLGEAWVREAA